MYICIYTYKHIYIYKYIHYICAYILAFAIFILPYVIPKWLMRFALSTCVGATVLLRWGSSVGVSVLFDMAALPYPAPVPADMSLLVPSTPLMVYVCAQCNGTIDLGQARRSRMFGECLLSYHPICLQIRDLIRQRDDIDTEIENLKRRKLERDRARIEDLVTALQQWSVLISKSSRFDCVSWPIVSRNRNERICIICNCMWLYLDIWHDSRLLSLFCLWYNRIA